MKKPRFTLHEKVCVTACNPAYDGKVARIEAIPYSDDGLYVVSIGFERFAAYDFQLRNVLPISEPAAMVSRSYYEMHKTA